jgi:hypothetical protein
MIKTKQCTPLIRTILLTFYTFGFVVVGATIPCTNNKAVCNSIKGLLFGIATVLIYVLIWQIFNIRIIKIIEDKIIISNHLIRKVKKIKQPMKLEIRSFSEDFKTKHGESFFQIYNLLIHKLIRLILFKNVYYSVSLIENGKSKKLIQDLTEQEAKRVLNFLKKEANVN